MYDRGEHIVVNTNYFRRTLYDSYFISLKMAPRG